MYITIKAASLPRVLRKENVASISIKKIMALDDTKINFNTDNEDTEEHCEYAISMKMTYGTEYITEFYNTEEQAKLELENLADTIRSAITDSKYRALDGTEPTWREIQLSDYNVFSK